VSTEASGTTKSVRTKGAILDAAEELFSAHGFDGASLDAIGEQAGIQGTAILYHYPSKRALYEATLERLFQPLLGELAELLAVNDRADDRLEAAVEVIVAYAAAHPNAPRLLVRETATPGGDARQIIEAKAAASAAGVMEAFASHSEQHDLDPVVVANILVGAICFYFVGPPSLAGAPSYDPRSPELVEAFSLVMRDLVRSLLRLRTATG